MTKEEAITIMQLYKDELEHRIAKIDYDIREIDLYSIHFDAFEVAIEALSAEAPKPTGELIARADAIEAVMAEGRKVYTSEYANAERVIYEADAVEALSMLPSAEAVQGWIPFSERLPSESGDYLCTIPLDEVDTYTEVLTFHKGRFYEDDDEWGATYHDDVVAWMPLPKPYREDGEV